MTTRWYQEKKHEHFYRQAKKQGYRARSAYKLKQIQKKYQLISKGDIIVDLGAAPGGWSQVAVELSGESGTVISVDINRITPLHKVICIKGDMTSDETQQQLIQALEGKKADVVLSDMSPDITGNYSVDQARSLWLCQQAFDVVRIILKPHGHFVCKLFEGEDKKEIIKPLKQSFYIVKQFSPPASRKSSSESYLIAKRFKG